MKVASSLPEPESVRQVICVCVSAVTKHVYESAYGAVPYVTLTRAASSPKLAPPKMTPSPCVELPCALVAPGPPRAASRSVDGVMTGAG